MKLKSKFAVLFAATVLVSCGGAENETTSTPKKPDAPKEEVVEEVVLTESSFGDLMVELESNMGWESVNESWVERREAWVSECAAASDIATKANLLLEFEAVVEWSAVDQSWADVREAWGSDVTNAASDGALGDLLEIFESYILWDVVSPNWAQQRPDWIERCEAIE